MQNSRCRRADFFPILPSASALTADAVVHEIDAAEYEAIAIELGGNTRFGIRSIASSAAGGGPTRSVASIQQ
jgi:hypothetical protein